MKNKKMKISLRLILLSLTFLHFAYPEKQSGTTAIEIPFLGNVPLKGAVDITEPSYTAEIAKPLVFQDATITKAKIKFDSGMREEKEEKRTPFFSISCDIEIHGLEFGATIRIGGILEKHKDKYPGGTAIAVEGHLKQESFKPFEKTNIPTIKDITVGKVKLGLKSVGEAKEFSINGESTILKTDVNVEIKFVKISEGTGIIASASLKPNWKLSNIIPKLKDTPLESLKFKKAQMIVSSINESKSPFEEDIEEIKMGETDIRIKKGISLVGKIEFSGGLFDKAKKVMSNDVKEVTIYGTISTNIKDIAFGARLPGILKFEEGTFRSFGLGFEISPTFFALITKATIKPTPDDPDLDFTARVQINPDEFEFSGSMEGRWNNALGIKGFDLADVGIEALINFEQLAATGIPLSGLGFTGKFYIDDIIYIEIALLLTTKIHEIIAKGVIKNLTLKDILKISKKMDTKIPEEKIPDLGIREGMIYCAPTGGEIGEFSFDPGMAFTADIVFFGKEGKLNLAVNAAGISGEGYLSKIELPVKKEAKKFFVLTGAGLDEKKGTEDDGPTIKISLTPSEQSFFLSGMVKILGISQEIDLHISPQKIYFKIEKALLNGLWTTKIEGSTVGENLKKLEDFWIVAKMKEDFFDFLAKKAVVDIEKFRQKTTTRIDKAKAEVETIQTEIDKINNNINEKQLKVDTIKTEIDKTNDYYKNLPPIRKAFEWIWIGPKLAGLYIARGVATAGLETARGVSTGSLELAKITALETLEASKKISLGLADVGEKLAEGIGKIFRVKKARFEGHLKELTEAKLPRLKAEIVFFGKDVSIDMQWDLKSPETITKSISKLVKDLFERKK